MGWEKQQQEIFAAGYRARVKALSGRAASYGSEPGFSNRSQVLSAFAGRNTFFSTLENNNGRAPVPTIS